VTLFPTALIILGLTLDPSPREAAAEPSAEPAPQAGGAPRKPEIPPEQKLDALPAGETRIRAETQGRVAEGHYQARGFVDVRLGDMRIQCDRADVYEEKKPDGKLTRRLVAEENVVFLRGEERLAGERLEIDMDTGLGFFEDAIGYVQPGVFVEGKRIERLGEETYRVEGGRFTSCAQPNPRWIFDASSARIEVDDKVVARNAVFKIKSVPVFYLPYLYYPIREDQRSTGFLFPHVGHSSTKGYELGTGFFWAMGRSFDQTFYADHYSKIGWGFGHEFRYAAEQPSRGTFRTYVIRTNTDQPLDYDLDWNALQMLPGKFRATVNVRQYSDLLFQQQYQDNFNLATTRTRRSAGNIQRSFGTNIFTLAADNNETFFGDDTRVQQHLPSVTLRRFPQKIGKTGIVFGYEAKAERVGFGAAEAVESFSRFDIAPQVSRPLTTSFLSVTPQGTFRYTRYSSSYLSEEGATTVLGGPPIDRPFFEGTLDVRGPSFSRVFDVGGGYTDRIKHIIGPEINWLYRTRVEDFDQIPKFDGTDYYLGTNQIDFALVQRLLAKRPGPNGKTIPHEFLSWRIGQTYYVKISDGQNNFDPNYSSSAFGPGYTPEHLSAIQSRLRVRPVPGLTGDFNIEYDVNFKQLRTVFFSGGINGPRGSLLAGWSRVLQLAEKPEDRVTSANTLRGAGTLQVVPRRVTLNASANYDFVRKELLQSSARLRWETQCCGFSAEMIRYNYNQRQDRQYRFSIDLANVGSIGNFLDENTPGARQGLGGYR
jgi:LPS-assembly protein